VEELLLHEADKTLRDYKDRTALALATELMSMPQQDEKSRANLAAVIEALSREEASQASAMDTEMSGADTGPGLSAMNTATYADLPVEEKLALMERQIAGRPIALTRGATQLATDFLRGVAAAAPPDLQLLTVGVTISKEDAFNERPTLCRAPKSENYNRPRPGNEDAFFIAGDPRWDSSVNFQFRARFRDGPVTGLFGQGGANAAGIADGIGSCWPDFGISSAKAAGLTTQVCRQQLWADVPLKSAMTCAHDAACNPHNDAAGGMTTFLAYQLRRNVLEIQNLGDGRVFHFRSNVGTGKWQEWTHDGEMYDARVPLQFGLSSTREPLPIRDLRDRLNPTVSLFDERLACPGDVVVAMSDGIIDCLSTDLTGTDRVAGAASKFAPERVLGIVMHFAKQNFAPREFCIAVAEALLSEATKISKEAYSNNNRAKPDLQADLKRHHQFGSAKPDDLTCVVSLVLNNTPTAQATFTWPAAQAEAAAGPSGA